jgi:tripartite-type tricarboxylate transporter receptor subunit TctC
MDNKLLKDFAMKMVSKHCRCLVSVLAALCLAFGALGAPVHAQEFPSREMKLVVGFPPGGGIDVTARILAEYLGRTLRTRIIPDNKSGANGAIAARFVAMQAEADGYTLLYGSSNMAVNLHGMKDPGYKWEDFAVIGGANYSPLMLIMNTASSKGKTLKEVIEFGKANPDKLTFATNGSQSVNNLISRRLDSASGIGWRELPYRGSAQIMQDLLAGNVDAFFGLPSTALTVQGQPNIAIIAVSDEKRMEMFPTVETFREAGYPMIDDLTAAGIWVPAATPKPVLEKLRAALAETVRLPEFKERIEKTGSLVYARSWEDFDAANRKSADQYGADFKRLGIAAQ